MLSSAVLLLALFASSQGRAVNISNTWVLPEEGFPVFYRYFRDRISWYEADAVCQFHHANLVTVDTTAQYDAVRAYLKELDISSAVWVGLIRSNLDGDFTWTDYRGLSGDGYWSAAPDARAAPLCAAADPAADYRWEARACGGPTVASFICELPVPQWASGNEGCMVRALPALTILYLPESAAVQLTADCGLAGVKRVQCTGNVKREDLLKDLSCNEEEELTSTSNVATEGSSTLSSDLPVNATDLDLTTEDFITTRHESIATTQATPVPVVIKSKLPVKQKPSVNKLNNMYAQKNINLDLLHNNNLQSNDIPKLANNENFLTKEQSEKLEDEKHMHIKMLHEELAQHGNFETIFTQPTDHFVPPLVMAKSKISDDMTVLSLAEKHAQQLVEQHKFDKHNLLNRHNDLKNSYKSTTEGPNKTEFVDTPSIITLQPELSKANIKTDKIKSALPKKYNDKYDDPKAKSLKIDGKLLKFEKSLLKLSTPNELTTKMQETSTTEKIETSKVMSDDNSLELTVVLREPKINESISRQQDDVNNIENITKTMKNDFTTEISATELTPATTLFNQHTVSSHEEITTSASYTANINTNKQEITHLTDISTADISTTRFPFKTEAIMQDIAVNREIIKITIVNDNNETHSTNTIFEVTTMIPQFQEVVNSENKSEKTSLTQTVTPNNIFLDSSNNTTSFPKISTTQKEIITTTELVNDPDTSDTKTKSKPVESKIYITKLPLMVKPDITTTPSYLKDTTVSETHNTEYFSTTNIPQTTDKEKVEVLNITEIYEIEPGQNSTDPDAIDDYNSPLLSAANEPLHRPNRSRRPQPPNRLTKFSPFRILG